MIKYIFASIVLLLNLNDSRAFGDLNLEALYALAESDHSRPQFILGNYHESKGNVVKAEAYYKKAALEDAEAGIALSILYDKQNKKDEASYWLNDARIKKNEIAQLAYACELIERKKWDAARTYIKSIIKDQQLLEHYYILSYILLKTASENEALYYLRNLQKSGRHFTSRQYHIAKFKQKVEEEAASGQADALLFLKYC